MIETPRLLLRRPTNDMLIAENLWRDEKVREFLGGIISDDLIKQKVKAGKPYIGTSAGSIIAGPKIPIYLEDPDSIKLDDYTGFNFTDTIIVPHWGSVHFKEMYLEQRLKLAYDEKEPAFLLLSDYHYISINENGIEIINTNE